MQPPSLSPLPALLLGEDSPILISTLSQAQVPHRAQPGSWGRRGWGVGRRVDTPWCCAGPVLLLSLEVQDLGLTVVEQGGRRRTSGRLAFPAQLCGCLLLSPEQGRRTEEPLKGSQQADWGGFAVVGSGHRLGAGKLRQLLCGRFLVSGPLIPPLELCSVMRSI